MSIPELEEAERKRKALLNAFDELPDCTIYGVVDASGAGGGNVPPETLWSLSVKLIAWKKDDGSVNLTPLRVMKMVSHDELRRLMDSINPEKVIGFRGRLCEETPFGDAQSLMVELVDAPADEELNAALRDYQEPITIRDPVLGELSLNKTVDWYEGYIDWCGKPVQVALSVDESGDVGAAVATIKGLLQDQPGWKNKIESYAVDSLLELKNDNWLDEGEEEVTKSEFIDRMELESITAYPEGEYEFNHNDGGLFWGHSIRVSGDLKGGPNDADIPG